MRFKAIIILIMIVVFLFSGCGKADNNKFITDNGLDKNKIMESYKENEQETAMIMAELYVEYIKKGKDLSNGEEGIEMFDQLFERKTLTINSIYPEENTPDGYRCDIAGSGPNGYRKIPLYIIFQENNPGFFCPLTSYGKQSETSIRIYLEYLNAKDAAGLSKWLSIDGDSDLYIDEADRLIELYEKYDLSQTEIVKFDYNINKERFVYTVEDAKHQSFEVFLIYGDGFVMPDIYYDNE